VLNAAQVNRYKVNAGVKADKDDVWGLEYWQSKGWIHAQDPYGWIMWYWRFFQGRRSADDDRQIQRWLNCCGPKGRWLRNLVNKCIAANRPFDDESISPVIRQTLQHWAYVITEKDVKGAPRNKSP
jgi:hypothetical protein